MIVFLNLSNDLLSSWGGAGNSLQAKKTSELSKIFLQFSVEHFYSSLGLLSLLKLFSVSETKENALK